MENYFECMARYERRAEDGDLKRVRGTWLVEASSFTEAEGRALEGLRPYTAGDLRILSIKRAACREVYGQGGAEGAQWFRCKVELMAVNEKTGKVKKTPNQVMVEAEDMRGAMSRIETLMKGTVEDWRVAALACVELDGVLHRAEDARDGADGHAGGAQGGRGTESHPAGKPVQDPAGDAGKPSQPSAIGYAAIQARDEADREREALRKALSTPSTVAQGARKDEAVAPAERGAQGAGTVGATPARYTPDEEARLKAEAMATLPFTEDGAQGGRGTATGAAKASRPAVPYHFGADRVAPAVYDPEGALPSAKPSAAQAQNAAERVEMAHMRSFITDSLKRRESPQGAPIPGMEPVAQAAPDATYKAVVKAVYNSGAYGVPIWRLRPVARAKDDAAVYAYVKRMADEGIAERFGQTVRKKLAQLPQRFV